MKRYLLGKTGFEVSPIAYGGIVSTDEEQHDSNRYVAWALEQGINYFDIAPSYGDGEVKLGESLRPYRSQVYLACKTTERKFEAARHEFEQSQKKIAHRLFRCLPNTFALHQGRIKDSIWSRRRYGVSDAG